MLILRVDKLVLRRVIRSPLVEPTGCSAVVLTYPLPGPNDFPFATLPLYCRYPENQRIPHIQVFICHFDPSVKSFVDLSRGMALSLARSK